MDPAIHQSIAFLLLIAIGLLLKSRLKSQAELKGIKVLILCFALPATIFVALLKIKLTVSLMMLPTVGLMVNLVLFSIAAYLVIPGLIGDATAARKRTWMLLLPSMAPGLSCFPFLLEYLGEEALANAALADVGNKIFGLIILYLIAMRMYYRVNAGNHAGVSTRDRVKDLLLALVKEPINAVIAVALVLLGFGYTMDALPLFVQNLAAKGSALTTGMILVFIGLAMKIRRDEAKDIISLLLIRSSLAFAISAGLLVVFSSQIPAYLAMVIMVFPQSSCSFWPFAHMSAVSALEEGQEDAKPTFDLQTGLNILACSLPFSSLLIMTICSLGPSTANPSFCLSLALLMLVLGLVVKYLSSVSGKFMKDYWSQILQIREMNRRLRSRQDPLI